jgi:hypothetical protein
MCAHVHLDADPQFITTHHTARRMHQVGVARIALRVERPLDHQWTTVPAFDEARARVDRSGPFSKPQV